MLNMDNFLGSRPVDQMTALARMIGTPGMQEIYRRAADKLRTIDDGPPDVSLPPPPAPSV